MSESTHSSAGRRTSAAWRLSDPRSLKRQCDCLMYCSVAGYQTHTNSPLLRQSAFFSDDSALRVAQEATVEGFLTPRSVPQPRGRKRTQQDLINRFNYDVIETRPDVSPVLAGRIFTDLDRSRRPLTSSCKFPQVERCIIMNGVYAIPVVFVEDCLHVLLQFDPFRTSQLRRV